MSGVCQGKVTIGRVRLQLLSVVCCLRSVDKNELRCGRGEIATRWSQGPAAWVGDTMEMRLKVVDADVDDQASRGRMMWYEGKRRKN